MIDEKLLLEFIRIKKEEFEEEGFTNYKKHTGTLKNMESMEAITSTVDIHVLMNLTRVLNELIERIESGEFDKEKNNSLSTYTLPPNYAFHCAEKSIKPLNKLEENLHSEE